MSNRLKHCHDEMKQPADSLLDFGYGDGATTPSAFPGIELEIRYRHGCVRQVS
jgi:hypothetical protein